MRLKPEFAIEPLPEHLTLVDDPDSIAPAIIRDPSKDYGRDPEVWGVSAWGGIMMFDGEAEEMSPERRLVLAMAITGMTSKEMSRHVWLEETGIKNHIKALLKTVYGREAIEAADMSDDSKIRFRKSGLARKMVRRDEPMAKIVRPAASDRYRNLSDRQLQILSTVADGLGDDEVAGQLYIATSTVKHNLSLIRKQIGASRRALIATGIELYVGPASNGQGE